MDEVILYYLCTLSEETDKLARKTTECVREVSITTQYSSNFTFLPMSYVFRMCLVSITPVESKQAKHVRFPDLVSN